MLGHRLDFAYNRIQEKVSSEYRKNKSLLQCGPFFSSAKLPVGFHYNIMELSTWRETLLGLSILRKPTASAKVINENTNLRFWNQTLICLGSMLHRMGHSLISCCLLNELGLGHSLYTLSSASTCSGVYLTYFPPASSPPMRELELPLSFPTEVTGTIAICERKRSLDSSSPTHPRYWRRWITNPNPRFVRLLSARPWIFLSLYHCLVLCELLGVMDRYKREERQQRDRKKRDCNWCCYYVAWTWFIPFENNNLTYWWAQPEYLCDTGLVVLEQTNFTNIKYASQSILYSGKFHPGP